MTSRSQPVHRQFTQNIHRLIRQLRVICLYALIFSFLFSSFLSFFWFGCFSSLYNRCCCWFLCDAVCTHRISVCFFESQRHIDIQFSIAHNRIRYVYISIFMYDMLKFPISVVDVVALSARTLSFHLQFEFGVLVALVFFSLSTLFFVMKCSVLFTAAGFEHKMLISTHVFFVILS